MLFPWTKMFTRFSLSELQVCSSSVVMESPKRFFRTVTQNTFQLSHTYWASGSDNLFSTLGFTC